jgi:hypothetical protein
LSAKATSNEKDATASPLSFLHAREYLG